MSSINHHDAVHATMCSYLGLSARDVAEIGGFSDRFARDLLAGRRAFPEDIKSALALLFEGFEKIVQVGKEDVDAGENVIYIFRTNEQLRASPVGAVWPSVGQAEGAFVGPYRAAMFEVWRWASEERSKPVELVFAETPAAA